MLYRYLFVGDVAVLSSSYELWQPRSLLHHPFLFPASAQETWQWRFVIPWEGLFRGWEAIAQPPDVVSGIRACFELVTVVTLGVATVFAFLRLPRSYAIYMLLMFLGVLMWVDAVRPFSTVYRHTLLFFPGFLLLALAGKRVWFHRLLLLSFIPLLAIFTSLFVGWYWMG